jgi:hypothetical protein
MDRTVINETTLTGIADAIREKTGKTDAMAPLEMPTEITNIPTTETYEWTSGIGLTITQANEALYAASGAVLATYGKTLAYVNMYCTTVENFVGWTNYLPDNGVAVIYCTAVLYALLSDEQKTAVESKGYSISGSLT